jgi:hypothetical protein
MKSTERDTPTASKGESVALWASLIGLVLVTSGWLLAFAVWWIYLPSLWWFVPITMMWAFYGRAFLAEIYEWVVIRPLAYMISRLQG